MTTPIVPPQELVELALSLSKADGCVVVADEGSSANLRWANNTLTTNGVMLSRAVTVIAMVDGGAGIASGSVSRSAVTADDLEPLVRSAEQAARDNGPADDAQPLIEPAASGAAEADAGGDAEADAGGDAEADWDEPPAQTTIGVFGELAPALGTTFGRARSAARVLYGFVEHEVETSYVGISTGLRFRHVQPSGHIGITGKSADLSRSAWVGKSTRDFSDVDIEALDGELTRRLGWAERSVELPAGRYDTVLPPNAVADLMIYAYWTMGARDALDGRTVYSRPGGGTRIGERLSTRPVTLRSDPAARGLECERRVMAHASSSMSSVFDNGLPVAPTEWIRRGELAALIQTRRSAELTGQPTTPAVGNLIMAVDGAAGTVDDLVAGVERGLLLTCLWYIRSVDPQTLLLTGLTRDGVYLVENGEVVGAVNNFRFNESPIDVLDRFSAAGAVAPAHSREWGDYFPRSAMAPLRIPDFNMSTVSQAS